MVRWRCHLFDDDCCILLGVKESEFCPLSGVHRHRHYLAAVLLLNAMTFRGSEQFGVDQRMLPSETQLWPFKRQARAEMRRTTRL